MTSKEKIEYMLNKIREKARISPYGVFKLDCSTMVDEYYGLPPENAPVIFSRREQIDILYKFEKDGLLFDVSFESGDRDAIIILMNLDINTNDNPYDEAGRIKNVPKIEINNKVELRTKKGLLVVNEKTGFVKLNKVVVELNPLSKEFELLILLVNSPNRQSAYSQILKVNNKDTRRNLGFTLKKLKKGLGILPKGNSKNEDIFENIKGFGYKIIV